MPQTIDINSKKVEVEQVRNDWALALMSRGVIVKLSINRWRARARLTPEMLGLKFTSGDTFDFHQRYLELGVQKLFPPSEIYSIENIEQRARLLLSNYSFDTVWGKFVPYTAFDEWEKENLQLRADFFERARAIGSKYDSILATVKEEYKNMAKDVWARMYPESNSDPAPSFVEDFVQKILEKIPPREEIVSSFKYDSTYFIIPMPSLVEDNIAKAEQVKRQNEMANFNSELERQTKRRISDEYVKRKKELIDGFLESTVVSMRSYVAELCDSVLQSICQRSKSKVTAQNVTKIRGVIKKVKLLNFYDDSEISSLLKDLENEVGKIKGETDSEVVIGKLREIVDAGKKEFAPKNFNPAISVLEIGNI